MTEPFDNLEARDLEPGCTCGMRGLEPTFMACEPIEPGAPWLVLDAECEEVCETEEEKYAELIAWALNEMVNSQTEICRIHTAEWWARRAAQFSLATPNTAFDRYVEEQKVKSPTFAAEYERAGIEIAVEAMRQATWKAAREILHETRAFKGAAPHGDIHAWLEHVDRRMETASKAPQGKQ